MLILIDCKTRFLNFLGQIALRNARRDPQLTQLPTKQFYPIGGVFHGARFLQDKSSLSITLDTNMSIIVDINKMACQHWRDAGGTMEHDWQVQRQCGSLKPVFPDLRDLPTESNEEMKAAKNKYLSRKNIPSKERLILALDVPTRADAESLVTALGDSVVFYKLGLQIFMAGGYFELVNLLHEKGKKVFVDLKFFDVPETVKNAIQQLNQHRVEFATVHGNDEMLKAAVDERKNGLKILAVTVLTSLDEADIRELGFETTIKSVVESRAKRALDIGCDGVISSGIEAPALREKYGDKFLIVTPGIRPGFNRPIDDQKRTVDVEEALCNGADYIVVGRPILNAIDKKSAAESIQQRIATLFPK
jgi:orotidine-5'-phosphate decarboxylase